MEVDRSLRLPKPPFQASPNLHIRSAAISILKDLMQYEKLRELLQHRPSSRTEAGTGSLAPLPLERRHARFQKILDTMKWSRNAVPLKLETDHHALVRFRRTNQLRPSGPWQQADEIAVR